LIHGRIAVIVEVDKINPAVRLLEGLLCTASSSVFAKREPTTTFSRTDILRRA